MRSHVDVLVIGAGPAGLAAARTLSEAGIDYWLLSRETVPSETKSCGGFVTKRVFEEFEILPFNGCHEIRSIRIKFPGNDMIRVDFDTAMGYNVARDILGERLLRTVERHEETVHMRANVVGLGRINKKWSVRYIDASGFNEVHCNILIDCSGANPVSVKAGHVRKRLSPDCMGYAVQYYFQRDRPAGTFDCTNDFYYGSEFSPHGYAWVFPRGRETVVGTGGLVAKVRASGKRLYDYLDHLVFETEPVRTELAGTKIYKHDAAMMPLAGVVRPSYDNGIMLAGDAAGHCSPITGEGIYYSMMGGKLAGETAVESIRKKDWSRRQLARYEKRWTRKFGSDLKWGLWLQQHLIHQESSGASSAILRSRRNVRVVAEMLLGIRSVKSALIKIAPSYLRTKI